MIDDKIGSKVNNLLSLPEPNCTDFHAILRTTNSPNDVKQNNRYKTDQTRDRRDFSRRANHDKLQLKIVLKSYVKEPEREEVPKISMSVKGLTFISLARFTCRNHSLLTMAFPNPLQHYQSNLDPSTIEIEDILRFQSLDYLKQLNTTTSKPHSPSCQDGGLGIRTLPIRQRARHRGGNLLRSRQHYQRPRFHALVSQEQSRNRFKAQRRPLPPASRKIPSQEVEAWHYLPRCSLNVARSQYQRGGHAGVEGYP